MKTNLLISGILPCISISLFSIFSNSLSAQEIEWQQVLGGIHSEYLYDVKSTPDYGFLLAGSSFSEDSGNKSEKGQGDLDYFLWKMDELGKLEWQKVFGGSGTDYLYSVGMTSEGGYILGGSSDSPVSGDKKEQGFGNMDFWIIKIDPEGNEEWQLTLGGIGHDELQSVQQTSEGGYIIGGSSNSTPIQNEEGKTIGNKSEESRGNYDYWVVKLSPEGEIEWEKTYGGMFADQLKSLLITEDGYVIAGTSNSLISSDKTAENLGMDDFWIIKLDHDGKQQWQKTYGGDGDESLSHIIKTENGFLLAGNSDSKTSDTKKSDNTNGTDFWVIEITEEGEYIWDSSYDFGQWDKLVSLTKAEEDTYLLGGYASTETLGKRTDNKGINDYIALKINQRGEMLWSKTLGGKDKDELKGLTQTRDGGYILAGNSDSKKSDDKDKASIGGNDFWIIKLGENNKQQEERQLVEIYPNPTYQYTNIVISQSYNTAQVEVFDMVGRKLQYKELPYRTTPINLQGYPPGVYIFKIIVDDQTTDIKVIKKGNR